MSSMVDRVAEAIALAGNGGTWDDWYNEDQKEFHRKRARAAIKAMLEPTELMLGAGMSCAGIDLKSEWKAMIFAALGEDAALGEGGPPPVAEEGDGE